MLELNVCKYLWKRAPIFLGSLLLTSSDTERGGGGEDVGGTVFFVPKSERPRLFEVNPFDDEMLKTHSTEPCLSVLCYLFHQNVLLQGHLCYYS